MDGQNDRCHDINTDHHYWGQVEIAGHDDFVIEQQQSHINTQVNNIKTQKKEIADQARDIEWLQGQMASQSTDIGEKDLELFRKTERVAELETQLNGELAPLLEPIKAEMQEEIDGL